MADKSKIPGTEEAWESEQLGADENHVVRVGPEVAKEIDDSLGMQMISIRLQKSLIDSFKLLGAFHGIGYQPLMRDALKRFAHGEMQAIVSGLVESQRRSQDQNDDPPQKPAAHRSKKAA